jgi:hypothetical protein
MKVEQSKHTWLLTLIALLLLSTFWWGERGAAFDAVLVIPVSILISTAMVLLVNFVPNVFGHPCVHRWWHHVLLIVGISGAAIFSFMLGYGNYQSALYGCAVDGKRIQLKLERFHRNHQIYPPSLQVLNTKTPCSRYMHPSLLSYRLTDKGYELSYRDWMMLHRASESSGFEAHK